MKIWLSRKDTQNKRHIIMDVKHSDDPHVRKIIRNYILPKGIIPIRDVTLERVRYRFNIKYQEALVLTFPQADMSAGLQKRVMKNELIRYDPSEVPDINIDGFSGKLYDFQKVSVADLIEHEWLLNDDLGLGKTIQAVAVMRALAMTPTLIIGPKNSMDVWLSHISEYTDLEAVVLEGTAKKRKEILEQESHIFIVNYDKLNLHPELADFHWPLAIVDEYHRLKNPNTRVTKSFQQIQIGRCIPISGTPIMNRPEEIWTILNRLWPKKYPSYYAFCNNIAIRSGGTSGRVVGYNPVHMKETRDFLATHSIRRRKAQVIDDLPDEIHIIREVELYPKQMKLYKEILKDSKLRLANGEVKSINDIRSIYTRLRQACFSPELYEGEAKGAKIDAIKEDIEQLVAERSKAIVGSQWSKATRILQRELDMYNPAYVDGSVHTRPARLEQQDKFMKESDCHLYIGTIRANREAISLGEATYVLFADEDWSPAANDQFKGRSAAGGLRGVGKEKVTIIRYYAKDTIDYEVSEILKTKQQIHNSMIERDGGKVVHRSTLSSLRDLLKNA